MEDSEVWRDIVGLEGYQASNKGRIRSVDRTLITSNGQVRRYKSKILSPTSKNQYGHLKVKTPFGTKYVHHLVGGCFVGVRGIGEVYCHNNGDKTDNRSANIRIDSHSGNANDTDEHGTRLKNSKHPMSVLNEREVSEIRDMLKNNIKQRDIAMKYGVSRSTISAISTGRSWGTL